MPYCDKEYFALQLDPAIVQEIGADDEEKVNSAIETADNEIDTYISAWLPLTTVPKKIKECSFDIAHYYLYKKVPGNESPLKVRESYEDAIAFLTKVSKGILTLIPKPTSGEAVGEVIIDGDDMKFSDNDL